MISAALRVYQVASTASLALRMAAYRMRSSSLVGFDQRPQVLLGALAQVHQQRGVAAVVQDHVRAFALLPLGPKSKMRWV
jgi:hypothetical protein